MKKLSVKMLLSLLLALSAISLFAQQDPPLPPGDASGNDNKAPRNGAPLGSGIGLLLAWVLLMVARRYMITASIRRKIIKPELRRWIEPCFLTKEEAWLF